MKKQVIVVAGGKGLRMGADVPKQFLLLNGKPVLMHTLEAFYRYDSAIRIILVIPSEQQSYWQELCKKQAFQIEHQVVAGGETRFHSVKNGLQFVERDSVVAIHDGVRPLVSLAVIADAFETAMREQAAYPVIPVVDSIREKTETGSRMVDRKRYCLVQTPQVFLSNVLLDAYEQDYSEKFTDDVSVVEAYGKVRPVQIAGDPKNIKITTPVDLVFAEMLIRHCDCEERSRKQSSLFG
jgi:2-C-methyl-D-erythritol 4-phosphate cytidylyltransferase